MSKPFEVDPKLIASSPRRGASRSPEAMADLKESMQADGFFEAFAIPVVATPGKSLPYRAAQGHTRRDTAIALKLDKVWAVEVTEAQARKIELEGDKYTYGMYAGKAIEYVASEWPDVAAAMRGMNPNTPDSEVAAAIGKSTGLTCEIVIQLRRIPVAIAEKRLTPLIADLKRPEDAAQFFKKLNELNKAAETQKKSEAVVTPSLQRLWIRNAIKSADPRHSLRTTCSKWSITHNLEEKSQSPEPPAKFVVAPREKTPQEITINLGNQIVTATELLDKFTGTANIGEGVLEELDKQWAYFRQKFEIVPDTEDVI